MFSFGGPARAPAMAGYEDIPVDEEGHVPLSAIVARYQLKGSRRDSSSTSSRVIQQCLTPKEIKEWWDDTGSCDIDGVDTADSPIYAVPSSIRGRKRRAMRRIGVISDKKEAARIRRVIASHFTADELELLASGCSVVISTVPEIEDCTGFFLRRQNGFPVPEIVLEYGTSTDGIVHEVVHALRAKDGRAPFPTGEDGYLDEGYEALPKRRRDAIESREERETVAETVARTLPDPVESGYYSRIPGMDSRTAYLRDQAVISRSRALKGQAAIKAAERNFDRTTISRAIITSKDRRRRDRCTAAGGRSASRRTPRASPRPCATSIGTSDPPGCSSTGTPGRSTPGATPRGRNGGGGGCATAWTAWSCTARPPGCPMSP